MRETPAPPHPHGSPAAPDIGQVLELLEIAWERGRGTLSTAPLSAAQTRVMYIIEREPGINASTLGRRLSAAAPSVTRLCDRLQAAGFLRRTPRPQDRREMQLELTDSGTAHLHGIRHRRELALQQAMSRMAPDARHALATGLSALCDAVSEPTQSLGHRETA
ncbi:MarR family transcriptional regulator [Streptomyces uncialis]|uniref:MarR family transcriptional regulator n=1 Tax=Streptomyces uncialis TaxID=1048205 RepID=A0A1Q4V7N0_9ACTN|nr:MarR family transcriptional regulator [Streptomyces uncialis]MCX4661579.1 MarR family transcriptional regulator [Streptomyces uncialis]OKH93825.1 MarR family transcriptional regulator [Streptomyces uncialis]WST72472.1 MarR family transcriptional regulator [Streptomyces uncialis]WTE08854.1 MarR family transcriptional regulator [Streptomyces uncialis]